MSKNIRIIITEPGGDCRPPRALAVAGHESLFDLNAAIIPEYSNPDHVIKWIYLGHTISETLPRNVESGSTFHVVVRQSSRSSADPHGVPLPQSEQVSDVDKNLLTFMHVVFAIFLAFLWNQFIQDRQLFTGLSLTVLTGLSCVFLLSLVQQVYPI